MSLENGIRNVYFDLLETIVDAQIIEVVESDDNLQVNEIIFR